MADPSDLPVLTIGPDVDSLNFRPAYQNFIESKMENGLRTTRARHTWTPNVYTVKYTSMTDQDRLDLQMFYEDTVGSGALSFLWFNTQDFQTYEMKFINLPQFQHKTGLLPERRWNVTLEMIEAGQTHAYGVGGRLNEGRLNW